MKMAVMGMGASACLALALAGCANKYGVERIDYAAAPPAAIQPDAIRIAPAPACPAIGVMPFMGVADNPACGYMVADAMADELLNCSTCQILAPDAVTARAGIKAGEDWDPVETGIAVGVPYILAGRVTDYVESDDGTSTVGMAMRLIESGTGRVVWTGDGAKTVAALPEGGIAELTTAVCGDLAHELHAKLGTAPTPSESIRTAAAQKTDSAPTMDGSVADGTEAKSPDQPENGRIAESPAPQIGEGTADWAIPLDKMDEYLQSTERGAAPSDITKKAEDAAAKAKPAEAVSSVFGNESEQDMTPGEVLVPGAMTVTFANDDIRPDEFGLEATAAESFDGFDSGVNPVETAAFAGTPDRGEFVPQEKAAGDLEIPEAETDSLAVPDLPLAIEPGLKPAAPSAAAPVTETASGAEENEMSAALPDAFPPPFTAGRRLELEAASPEPEKSVNSADDAELDFFGNLSDTLLADPEDGGVRAN